MQAHGEESAMTAALGIIAFGLGLAVFTLASLAADYADELRATRKLELLKLLRRIAARRRT
jgi:hypothetical protein